MKQFARSLILLSLLGSTSCENDLWWTPDQQGMRQFERGEFAEAAQRFVDPMWQGVAWYRAGDFEAAAAAFGRLDTPESTFNRGVELVLQGDYDGAIQSFDRALTLRPDWREALENRELARARKERMKPPEDDHGGTGGALAADKIVFDDRAKNSSSKQVVEVGAGERLSDEELSAMWLRRVQTKPADFLRVKFAYQNARKSRPPGGER